MPDVRILSSIRHVRLIVVVGTTDSIVVLVGAILALLRSSRLQAFLGAGVCITDLQSERLFSDRYAVKIPDDFIADPA